MDSHCKVKESPLKRGEKNRIVCPQRFPNRLHKQPRGRPSLEQPAKSNNRTELRTTEWIREEKEGVCVCVCVYGGEGGG